MPGFQKEDVMKQLIKAKNKYAKVLECLSDDDLEIGSVFDIEILCNERLHYLHTLQELFAGVAEGSVVTLSPTEYLKIYG